MLPKQTNYNVGMYLRLSKDDERSGESLSIENQRKVLTIISVNRAGLFTTNMLMMGIREQVLRDLASSVCSKMLKTER